MIFIDSTAHGLLITRDKVAIEIARCAVPLALPVIIHELTDAGRAQGLARREGYEMGLIDGRTRALIEFETSQRIADRQADDLIATLAAGIMASAA